MLFVMCVVDEFEPKEATNLVSPPKCVNQVLDELSDVTPERLLDELPSKRQVDRAIEVMPKVAPPAKAPYQMNHEELKELKVQLEELFIKGYIKPSKLPCGPPVFFIHKKDRMLKMCVDYRTFNKAMVKN
jgi:putative transposase